MTDAQLPDGIAEPRETAPADPADRHAEQAAPLLRTRPSLLERNAALAGEVASMRARMLQAEAASAMRGLEVLRLIGQIAQLTEQLRQARLDGGAHGVRDERLVVAEARAAEVERQRDAALHGLERARDEVAAWRHRATTAEKRLIEWSAAADITDRPSRRVPSGRMPTAR